MKTLDRYIFKEIFFPSLIALVALTFVAFIREIGALLEVMVRQSATISEIGAISLAILPSVLTFTIPMAVLVGILTGFGRMSSDQETIAFRAAGISMKRLLLPVMLIGGLAWTANLALTVWIAPRTAARLRDLTYDVAVKQVSLELRPRVFNERLTDWILYVQDVAPPGLNWRGIMLADLHDPNDPRVTFARSGSLVANNANHTFQLTLRNGNTHFVSPLAPNRYSFSSFDTNTISIPMPEAPPKPEKVSLTETDTRSIWNHMAGKTATYEERVDFHRRFALPFACLFFALVGLPLGVSTTRGGKSMGLVLSLILMLAYYLAFIGGTRIANNAQFSPFLGAWLPNLGFAALAVFLFIRSDHAYENRVLGQLASAIKWISEKAG